MVLLRLHVLFSVVFLHRSWQAASTPEDAFLGYPLQIEEEPFIYLDSRAEAAFSPSAIKQSETRRRSTLDKNFARFGRNGGRNALKTTLSSIDEDPDTMEARYNGIYITDADDLQMARANFGRSPRSGEKNDQFIRFGRGNSDFLRFGRSAWRSSKDMRKPRATGGRQTLKVLHDRRRKRSASSLQYYSKKADGTNFMRFGRRDGNDNFMRFGRVPDYPRKTDANATNSEKYSPEMRGARRQSHGLLLAMLADQLTRSHLFQKMLMDAMRSRSPKETTNKSF